MNLPSPIKMILICVVFLTKMATVGYAQSFHSSNTDIPYPSTSTANSFEIITTGTPGTTHNIEFGFVTQAIDPFDVTKCSATWYIRKDNNVPTATPAASSQITYDTSTKQITLKTKDTFTLPKTPADDYSNYAWFAASISNDGCAGDYVSQWIQLTVPVTLCPMDIQGAKYNSTAGELELYPHPSYTYYEVDNAAGNSESLNNALSESFTTTLWGGAVTDYLEGHFSFIKILKSDKTTTLGSSTVVKPDNTSKEVYAFELGKDYYICYGTKEHSVSGTAVIPEGIPLLQIKVKFNKRPEMTATDALPIQAFTP